MFLDIYTILNTFNCDWSSKNNLNHTELSCGCFQHFPWCMLHFNGIILIPACHEWSPILPSSNSHPSEADSATLGENPQRQSNGSLSATRRSQECQVCSLASGMQAHSLLWTSIPSPPPAVMWPWASWGLRCLLSVGSLNEDQSQSDAYQSSRPEWGFAGLTKWGKWETRQH